MYSLVLMMALGNGAYAPSIDASQPPALASYAHHSHILNRGCRGCHRCSGCYGCYGCWCYGCYGCCYGCYGCACYGGWCHGCYGGYASYGYYGSAIARTDTTAKIVVRLPADAKLTVDNQTTTSQSDRRTFISPPLQNGGDYYYTLKAQVVRDGKSLTATKRVIVQAGKETEVKFDFDTATVALR
jgi:uncharacterized protein (TIGR03000 family)